MPRTTHGSTSKQGIWNGFFVCRVVYGQTVSTNGPMGIQNLGGARTIGLKVNVILLDKTSSFQAL
jgi:hypothetical protein